MDLYLPGYGPTVLQNWEKVSDVVEKASSTPVYLRKGRLGCDKKAQHEGHFYLYKGRVKGRKSVHPRAQARRANLERKARAGGRFPWLISVPFAPWDKHTDNWADEPYEHDGDCDWLYITFTMPHLLWPLLNDLFRCSTRAMQRWAPKQGIEVGIFCTLHTYGRQLNQHPHIRDERQWRRYISHIPSRHFKMVRYYGFLSNRKWAALLPKVYSALEMTAWKKPDKPGFAVLMKCFVGTDPYKCILCGDRLRFTGAQAGSHTTELLSERLRGMEKKRWLRMPALDQCAWKWISD